MPLALLSAVRSLVRRTQAEVLLPSKSSPSLVLQSVRRGRVRIGLVLGLAACAVPTTLWVAHSQTAPAPGEPVTHPVDPTHATIHGGVNGHFVLGQMDPMQMAFNGTPDVAPTGTSECRLSDGTEKPSGWSAASYKWDYTPVGGTGWTVSKTPPTGSTAPAPAESAAGTANFTFSAPGDYYFDVTLTITYTADCKEEGSKASSEPIVLNGTIRAHVHVAPDDGTGGTVEGGTVEGGTETGGTETGGTEAGGTEAGGTEAGGTEAGGTEAGGTEAGGTEAGGTNGGGTQQGASVKATATSSSSIELSWGPALGKLYRSTQKDFTASDNTLILTVEPNPDKTPPTRTRTDTGLTGNTTYYYIFVPTDAAFTQGSTNETTLKKTWYPGNPIAGGAIVKPESQAVANPPLLIVEQNTTLDLEVSSATDSDQWSDGPVIGSAPDKTITYHWSGSGGFTSPNSAATKWKAPPLPEGVDSITDTLKVVIKDSPLTPSGAETGTRQDKQVERSIPVKIQRPVWKADPKIGQHRETDGPKQGQLVPDGRMIAPQDQRGTFDPAKELTIGVGARVPVGVEGATDLDTYTPVNGDPTEPEDNVYYQWKVTRQGEGSKGSWQWIETVNGQQVTKTGTDAPTTLSAWWIAPKDITGDTHFTLSCSLSNTPPAPGKPLAADKPKEGGTRGPEGVERTVKLKVSEDVVSSNISPVIYTHGVNDGPMNPVDMTLTTQPGGPIGGQKTLGVSLFIGHNGRVRPDVNWVTVRIQEEKDSTTDPQHSITHPFEENHVDYTFDLNSSSWRKILVQMGEDGGSPSVVAGAVETTGSPKDEGPGQKGQSWMYMTKVTGVAGDTLRYTNVLWNTTGPHSEDPDGAGPLPSTKLLGHNGKHKVEVVAFGGTHDDSTPGGEPWSQHAADDGSQGVGAFPFEKRESLAAAWEDQNGANPQSLDRDVQNLVISEASTNQDMEDDQKIADYFKFDPQSEDDTLTNPEVTFKIDNDSAGSAIQVRRYHWWLWVRATTINGFSNFVTYEGDVDKAGAVTVAINKDSASYRKTDGGDLTEWGTYAFDIGVQDTLTGDTQYLRSEKLSIPDFMADSQGNPLVGADGKPLIDEEGHLLPGHDVFLNKSTASQNPNAGPDEIDPESANTTQQNDWYASYLLKGERDASKMRIDLLKPNLSDKVVISGARKVGVPHLNLHLYTEQDAEPDGPSWKGVFTATDNYRETYRQHKAKPMLSINKARPVPFQLKFRSEQMKTLGSQYKLIASSDPKTQRTLQLLGARIGRAFSVDKNNNVANGDSAHTFFDFTKGMNTVRGQVEWEVYNLNTNQSEITIYESGKQIITTTGTIWKKPETYLVIAKHISSAKHLYAKIYAADVPPPAENGANGWKEMNPAIADLVMGSATIPISAAAMAAQRSHDNDVVLGGTSYTALDDPDSTPRNALKHSLWNALIIRYLMDRREFTYTAANAVARDATYSHERPVEETRSNDNTSAMDVFNNQRGREVFFNTYTKKYNGTTGQYYLPSDEELEDALVNDIKFGAMTILDTWKPSGNENNKQERGILIKSR